MLLRRFKRHADYRQSGSLAGRMRAKRFRFFETLFSRVPRPARILDIGGTESFWDKMGMADAQDLEITVLNQEEVETTSNAIRSIAGDASMPLPFESQEFDVVFSNSVIEHLGSYRHQRLMAQECARVGKRLFIQTPNVFFPIEPHFLLPAFQFWPLRLQAWTVQRWEVSWYSRFDDRADAEDFISSFRLLSASEMRELFPASKLYRERIFGVTKSFVAYQGF